MAKSVFSFILVIILVISARELYAEDQSAASVESTQVTGTPVSEEGQAEALEEKQLDDPASKTLVSKEATFDFNMVTKAMSGEISARGPSGIALVYEKDEKLRSSREMWFPYEGEIKLAGYKDKMDIGEGDRVTITYDEAEDRSKRILTGIKLNTKYVPPIEEVEVEEDEEEAEP